MIVLVLWLRVRSSRFTDRIDLPVLQSIQIGTDGLAFKGFYGTYELEITADGKTEKRDIHLDRHSNNKFDIII